LLIKLEDSKRIGSNLDECIKLTFFHAVDIDKVMSRPWRVEFSGDEGDILKYIHAQNGAIR
jgi:hypothetical protein